MVMTTDWWNMPTRAELEADEAAERRAHADRAICDNCGEQRPWCTCTPPQEWEELEMDEEW